VSVYKVFMLLALTVCLCISLLPDLTFSYNFAYKLLFVCQPDLPSDLSTQRRVSTMIPKMMFHPMVLMKMKNDRW